MTGRRRGTGEQDEATRRMSSRTAAMVLAWLAFFPIPVIGSLLLWAGFERWAGVTISPSTNSVLQGVGVIIFMFGLAAGVMKCSIWQSATGLLACAGLGTMGGSALVGVGLLGAALVWLGLMVTYTTWYALKPEEVDGCESADDRARRNPRCGTCHVRKACPLQPGGIADRYKQVPISEVKQLR